MIEIIISKRKGCLGFKYNGKFSAVSCRCLPFQKNYLADKFFDKLIHNLRKRKEELKKDYTESEMKQYRFDASRFSPPSEGALYCLNDRFAYRVDCYFKDKRARKELRCMKRQERGREGRGNEL
jgi:hypothetical protein